MGIKSLLIHLKSIIHSVHISKYSGKVVGIDIFGWLHKGAYGCCVELAKGEETNYYITYCMEKIELLKKYKIKPLVVFDGASVPCKSVCNADRGKIRQVNYEKGIELLSKGDESGSFTMLSRATSVNYSMTQRLIKELNSQGIDFIVAPYEADAQLAYLSRCGIIDVVISEDSDCIPYGCKTILYKMDAEGNGNEFRRKTLGACEKLEFNNWTEDMFLQMCVLGGCDYCPTIPGVGLITAYKIVMENRKPQNVLKSLHEKYPYLERSYDISFYQALLTFRHQWIYDPRRKTQRMLHRLEKSKDFLNEVENVDFLGKKLDDSIVQGIAEGKLHCWTYEPLKYDSNPLHNPEKITYDTPHKKENCTIQERRYSENNQNNNSNERKSKAFEAAFRANVLKQSNNPANSSQCLSNKKSEDTSTASSPLDSENLNITFKNSKRKRKLGEYKIHQFHSPIVSDNFHPLRVNEDNIPDVVVDIERWSKHPVKNNITKKQSKKKKSSEEKKKWDHHMQHSFPKNQINKSFTNISSSSSPQNYEEKNSEKWYPNVVNEKFKDCFNEFHFKHEQTSTKSQEFMKRWDPNIYEEKEDLKETDISHIDHRQIIEDKINEENEISIHKRAFIAEEKWDRILGMDDILHRRNPSYKKPFKPIKR